MARGTQVGEEGLIGPPLILVLVLLLLRRRHVAALWEEIAREIRLLQLLLLLLGNYCLLILPNGMASLPGHLLRCLQGLEDLIILRPFRMQQLAMTLNYWFEILPRLHLLLPLPRLLLLLLLVRGVDRGEVEGQRLVYHGLFVVARWRR